MLSGCDIICMNDDGLDGLRRPRAILMEMLAKNNRVLFVSSASQSFFQRQHQKILPFGGLRRVSKNLYWLAPPTVFREIYNPFLAPLACLSTRLRYLCIRAASLLLGFKKPLLYIAFPTEEYAMAARSMDSAAVIYDVHDRFMEHEGSWFDVHFAVLKCTDAVFTNSRVIESELRALHDRVFFHPHGVDTDLFKLGNGCAPPTALDGLAKPLIGLVGSLGSQIDWSLLDGLAALRKGWSFVFVGPLIDHAVRENPSFQSLCARANVRFVPKQPHRSIPGFISAFDACILPYVKNWFTMGVNPLKLLEYLACGKPVVCSPIPSAYAFADYIRIASSLDDWNIVLEEVLRGDTKKREAGMQLVASHSYHALVELISGDIEKAISNRCVRASIGFCRSENM
jgi:glycosyltransferase involved in cell wall biosynthesis